MITKKDFLNRGVLLNEQKTNKDFSELVSLLLHSRTQAHVLHLQTESYPEHMALNSYYDSVSGLIDGLVESYQGKYGILKNYKSYNLVEYKSTDSTIKYLSSVCDNVQKLRDCCKDSYIQNQIDTVCELINSTLYKLKFLK